MFGNDLLKSTGEQKGSDMGKIDIAAIQKGRTIAFGFECFIQVGNFLSFLFIVDNTGARDPWIASQNGSQWPCLSWFQRHTSCQNKYLP